MTAVLVCALHLSVQTPQVPGAEVSIVTNQALVTELRKRETHKSVVSDDGTTLFVYEGPFSRYVFGKAMAHGGEAIFHYVENGKPTSYTTSQFSHIQSQVTGERADPSGNVDVMGASDARTLNLGWNMSVSRKKEFRISLINWEKRGRHPNVDYRLQEKPHARAYLGLAWRSNTFFVGIVREGATDLYAIRATEGGISSSRLGSTAEAFYDEYDPVSKRFLRNKGGGTIAVAVLGSKKTNNVKLPQHATPFLSRGAIYAQNDLLYKLGTGHKWIKVGSGVRVLSKSANGRFWLVDDPSGKVWKVRFRS